METDVRDVLADVGRLSPFFLVRTGPDAGGPDRRPLRDLYTDPEPLRARIGHVRTVLHSDDRVAASIAFQGIAALVLSPPLAAVAVHGVLPHLGPDVLHWRPVEGGPWELWCPDPTGTAVADGAAALAGALFEDHLRPLVAAVRAQVSVSERVLWGSVASSVASGKRLIGAQRPQAADAAARVAERLLDTGPLAGTGERRAPTGPDHGWTFRRRSCCLYYRVRDGGLCGDCVLNRDG